MTTYRCFCGRPAQDMGGTCGRHTIVYYDSQGPIAWNYIGDDDQVYWENRWCTYFDNGTMQERVSS